MEQHPGVIPVQTLQASPLSPQLAAKVPFRHAVAVQHEGPARANAQLEGSQTQADEAHFIPSPQDRLLVLRVQRGSLRTTL